MPKKIFLIAGEASGDLQASQLIKALKQKSPDLIFRGLGGPLMAHEGMELTHDLTKEAVLGLGDVLKKYFTFRSIFNQALKDVKAFQPDVIILVDYPGFNLRFAKKINKKFPVVYYISPQIWAWHEKRIHDIRKTVDHLIVFFDFEEKLYQQHGVPVTWAGHPLVDLAKPTKSKDELRKNWLKNNSNKLVALLPGSRITEVKRILPEMIKTAKLIYKRDTSTQFLLLQSPTLNDSAYRKIIQKAKLPFELNMIQNRSFDVMYASDFSMVSSGTATLEAALSETPFVIFYKTAWSTFFLGRWLIKIPYIGLVNVVAGRKIVPEFIQEEIHPETIAQEAVYLLHHQDLKERMVSDLKTVRTKLGSGGASRRAAEAVLNFLSS